jgi:hypothetical protein
MFCPQCSTENEADQSYCRKCGLPLSAIRLAVDGRVDQALTKLKKSEKSLRNGIIVSILLLAVTLYAAVRSGPFEIVIDPLVLRVSNWLVGLVTSVVIGLPIVVIGLVRLRRARQLLEAPDEGDRPLVIESRGAVALPAATPITVTEDTTLKLSEPTRRQ